MLMLCLYWFYFEIILSLLGEKCDIEAAVKIYDRFDEWSYLWSICSTLLCCHFQVSLLYDTKGLPVTVQSRISALQASSSFAYLQWTAVHLFK